MTQHRQAYLRLVSQKLRIYLEQELKRFSQEVLEIGVESSNILSQIRTCKTCLSFNKTISAETAPAYQFRRTNECSKTWKSTRTG
jgi:hypothetical protein